MYTVNNTNFFDFGVNTGGVQFEVVGLDGSSPHIPLIHVSLSECRGHSCMMMLLTQYSN